jgi:hypothetical protein
MGKRRAKYALSLCATLLAFTAAGCVTQPMTDHHPSMQVLELLRNGNLPAMRVGDFTPGPGLSPRDDQSLGIRALTLVSPYDHSFSKYLQKSLEADLQLAGKLDPASSLTIEGELTDSRIDAGIGTGSATLSGKFELLKSGKQAFEKSFSVRAEWDSAFVGATAIPDAANQYTSLYDKLIVEFLADPDFKAAAAER